MLSMGWNPGLVVMGGDTFPRGTEINPSAKYVSWMLKERKK